MLGFISDEIAEILADFDLSNDELAEVKNIIKERLERIQQYLTSRDVFLVHNDISEESEWIVFAKDEDHAIDLVLRQDPDMKREWLHPKGHVPIDDPDEEI